MVPNAFVQWTWFKLKLAWVFNGVFQYLFIKASTLQDGLAILPHEDEDHSCWGDLMLSKQKVIISIEGNLIMEQSTQTLLEDYVSIYEKPQKKYNKYTDEEKAERARISTRSYYYKNIEKRERTKTSSLS